jgi:hypothetical protein
MPAALVPHRLAADIVAAALLRQRREQRRVRLALVQLRIDDADGAALSG